MAIGFSDFKGRAGTGKVKILGLKALNKSLTNLEKKSGSETTRQIHFAAIDWAKRANRDVPVDTGKLLRSIKPTLYRGGADIDVEADYAGFVEFGTKYMRDQPYFFKHEERVMSRLIRNIKKLLTL
jgi:HK97 gp10 family phage protein